MFEYDLNLIRGVKFQHEFLVHIYGGLTKAEACAQLNINPAAVAFARKEQAAFDIAIRDAEAFRVDMLVDTLINIQDTESDALMARVISDNIKWVAAKRLRDIYGDKTDITVSHVLSLKDAIAEAKQRTIEFIEHIPLENNHNITDNISVEQSERDGHEKSIDPLS